jgi:hypothetical protein
MQKLVNPFCDGISLKRGCGVPCCHLQCKISVCERARLMADGIVSTVLKNKNQVLSLINSGMYGEAIEIATELVDSGLVSTKRFEVFRLRHFSSQL